MGGAKRCLKCGEMRPLSDFDKDSRNSDGLATRCKHCRREYQRKHRADRSADASRTMPAQSEVNSPAEKGKIERAGAVLKSCKEKSGYYDAGGIETIDVIRAKLTDEQYIGFLMGNVIKYSSRINHKGSPARDAEKCAAYAGWLSQALWGGGAA